MSKRGSKVRKSKTRAKFAKSSQLNQSGNPVESQIGVAAEQPMHPAEIQRMLQLERLGPTPLDSCDPPTVAGIYHPSTLQPDPSGHSRSSEDHSPSHALARFHAANAFQPPQYFDSNTQDHSTSSAASSSHIHGARLASVMFGYPTEPFQHHPDFPADFNYTPLAVTRPRANLTQTSTLDDAGNIRSQILTRPTPYPMGIPPRPGETRPGERFNISSGQSVICSVSQGIRGITRNTSRIRLPPIVQPQPMAAATSTSQSNNTMGSTQRTPTSTPVPTPATIEAIRTGARSNFKRALFADTLLPDSAKLAEKIQNALFNAAVQHLGDGVNGWLEKDAVAESKKLKDVANNIRNDFKYAARLLIPQLYGLTLLINIRSQEAAFRQQRVAALLRNHSYLDEVRMVDGTAVVVPFGHPAVVQLILRLLWGDNYATHLPDDANIDAVVAFASTITRWVLRDHANVSICQSEFNTREHLPIHTEFIHRLQSLQGGELENYRELARDIYARGQEMIGLVQ